MLKKIVNSVQFNTFKISAENKALPQNVILFITLFLFKHLNIDTEA